MKIQFLHGPSRKLALSIAAALSFGPSARAQQSTVSPPPDSRSELAPVVVTGNPLRASAAAAPVQVLQGEALVLRRGGTLGETLDGLPGVSATYFGPNASRPIIRGLDGDRVRVLSNGGNSLDASSLSFDHAVPIDPLIVERVEVLRGPGALQYGGSAVGGVVNTFDNRIPKQRLSGPTGSAELRLGGAERGRGGAAVVETGTDRYALHADFFGRETEDLRVPLFSPVRDGQTLEPTRTVLNSASKTHGGAFGGSVFFGRGHLGMAVDTYDSRYGVVAEPDVTIKMKRDQVAFSGEAKDLVGWLTAVRGQLSDSRYRHDEVEGSGAVGTTFKTSGQEARLEVEHAPWAGWRGQFGLQWEDFDFSALGEEAFVPGTRTRKQALFAVEERGWAGGLLTVGGRVEQASIRSEGDAGAAEPKFGAAAERRFALRSASLSNRLPLGESWSATASFSVTERAPTAFELFANGVHAATGVYERGDAQLGKETGRNLDLALQWKSGPDHLRLGVFSNRFSRFIALDASGGSVDLVGEGGAVESIPEYVFRPVRARLNGVEVDGALQFVQAAWTWGLSGKLDLTRATNLDTGEALPRVAPLRLQAGLDARRGPWGARLDVEHAARQARVPATDSATAAYTLAHASLTRRFTLGGSDGLWFLKVNNLGNTLARNASTIQTVRDLSPLPGRSVKAGLRLAF